MVELLHVDFKFEWNIINVSDIDGSLKEINSKSY